MVSRVFYHKCGISDSEIIRGIIEFHTDEDGNTTAVCRECGKDVTHQIVIDEIVDIGFFSPG